VISASRAGYALDASALLALVFNEPGQEEVSAVIDHAYVHSVNVAEVVGKLMKEGASRAEAEQTIEELDIDIDEELPAHQAALCGELVAQTRQQGLSLGDCVCLTVASSHGSIAVTADRKWQELHGQRIDNNEIRVLVIR
jgi:PIN domain nuclease of toxin-antitoxin system